jgi:hypothetical protein
VYHTAFRNELSEGLLLVQDCDGDGQIDCQDYARIHKLGGVGCIKEPHKDFDDFKSDLDTCLAEVNASMLGIP